MTPEEMKHFIERTSILYDEVKNLELLCEEKTRERRYLRDIKTLLGFAKSLVIGKDFGHRIFNNSEYKNTTPCYICKKDKFIPHFSAFVAGSPDDGVVLFDICSTDCMSKYLDGKRDVL